MHTAELMLEFAKSHHLLDTQDFSANSDSKVDCEQLIRAVYGEQPLNELNQLQNTKDKDEFKKITHRQLYIIVSSVLSFLKNDMLSVIISTYDNTVYKEFFSDRTEIALHENIQNIKAYSDQTFPLQYERFDEILERYERVMKYLVKQYGMRHTATNGWSSNMPMDIAIEKNDIPLVKLLLTRDEIDVNFSWRYSSSLVNAVNFNKMEMTKLLLAHPKIKIEYKFVSALHFAVSYPEILRLFLDVPNININYQRELDNRWTALMCAADMGCTESVRILLDDPRIDAEITGRKGETALSLSQDSEHKECVELIEKHLSKRAQERAQERSSSRRKCPII